MLENSKYTWYNTYEDINWKIEPILVTAKNFASFNDLLNICVNRLPKNIEPIGLDDSSKFDDVKSRFERVF